MDSNDFRDQYLTFLASGDMTERSMDAVRSFWKRVEKAEQQVGMTLEDGYSEADYKLLLEKLVVTNVNAMRTTKSRIVNYLKYLCERGVLDRQYVQNIKPISYKQLDGAPVFEQRYYPTLSALQQTIEDCIDKSDRLDPNVFAMQISALYLAWYGVEMTSLFKIKKEDVHEDSIMVDGREIFPAPFVMDYIKEYRDADGYSSQANQIIYLRYKPSDLLFRTVRSPSVTDPLMLRNAIIAFAKSDAKEAKSLTYYKVYWSGLFNRAYLYEMENGDILQADLATKEKIFAEHYDTSSEANRRVMEYRQFREHFFPTSEQQ